MKVADVWFVFRFVLSKRFRRKVAREHDEALWTPFPIRDGDYLSEE